MTLQEKKHIYRNVSKLIKQYISHLDMGEDLKEVLEANLLEIQCQLNQIEVENIIQRV